MRAKYNIEITRHSVASVIVPTDGNTAEEARLKALDHAGDIDFTSRTQTATYEATVIGQARDKKTNAILVIVLNEKIHTWLKANDPKALEQLKQALED